MKRGFNACQTHCSMYPPVLNRFPVIQPVSSKFRHFSTFFSHFGLSWVHPCDNRGKCYMDGKRIFNACQHILIYLQPFTSYSEILVGNCNLSLLPVLGVSVINVSWYVSLIQNKYQVLCIMILFCRSISISNNWYIINDTFILSHQFSHH